MKQYTNLVSKILQTGERREDRTGTGVLSIFGGQLRFDLRERFPLVTAKETRWKTAFLEMLWFLRGESHTDYLHTNDCRLWDDWAAYGHSVGPIYGYQWRGWEGMAWFGKKVQVDQIRTLIEGIKTNPTSRRHIVSAWNVAQLDDMALPPCHWAFQCHVSTNGFLDMQVHQRSWDMALGAPFNIAGYALLLTLLARATNLQPRRLMFAFGDAHIYLNHVDAMREMVARQRYDNEPTRLVINTKNTDIDGYNIDDFQIVDYKHQPHMRLPIAV